MQDESAEHLLMVTKGSKKLGEGVDVVQETGYGGKASAMGPIQVDGMREDHATRGWTTNNGAEGARPRSGAKQSMDAQTRYVF